MKYFAHGINFKSNATYNQFTPLFSFDVDLGKNEE